MKRAEQILANILTEKCLKVAFAESMTCGLASHKLGTVSGTSEILMGSVICYDEKVKTDLLKVSKQLIKKYSAESQQVTDKLAINLSRLIKADICAAVTGLAAPGGSESKSKPVGTVFFSVYFRNKIYKLRKLYNGSPLLIKKKACDDLFRFITSKIK